MSAHFGHLIAKTSAPLELPIKSYTFFSQSHNFQKKITMCSKCVDLKVICYLALTNKEKVKNMILNVLLSFYLCPKQ